MFLNRPTGVSSGWNTAIRGPPSDSGVRDYGARGRNAVIMSTGHLDWGRPGTWKGNIDRSPCGTGTSAIMAQMHRKVPLGTHGMIWRMHRKVP
jgi:hypothetical protein